MTKLIYFLVLVCIRNTMYLMNFVLKSIIHAVVSNQWHQMYIYHQIRADNMQNDIWTLDHFSSKFRHETTSNRGWNVCTNAYFKHTVAQSYLHCQLNPTPIKCVVVVLMPAWLHDMVVLYTSRWSISSKASHKNYTIIHRNRRKMWCNQRHIRKIWKGLFYTISIWQYSETCL